MIAPSNGKTLAGATSTNQQPAAAQRPTKDSSMANPTNSDQQSAAKKRPVEGPPPVTTPSKEIKKTRINWGQAEHRCIMEKDVRNWLEKRGDYHDENGEDIESWKVFANKVRIPQHTFYKHINPNLEKNRGNDGMSRKEATNLLQVLNPNMS